jgi:rod shape determining protein RodA
VQRKVIADFPLVALALLLSVFGILMVYSAGQTDVPTIVARLYKSQIIWLAVSIGAAFLVSRASVRFLEWSAWPAYLGTIIILASLFLLGSGAGDAASSRSWLTIGGHRIGQPSEVAKITVVLMLARVLASSREAPKLLIELWRPVAIVAVPIVLILGAGDLGSCIVFVGILFAMLFWAGVPALTLVLLASPIVSLVGASSTWVWGAWFFLLVVLVWRYRPYLVEGISVILANVFMGIIAPIIWERKLKPYQRQRLLVFLDPSSDPRASGYHVIQSQVAIGSGGWFGKGFTMGTQKRLAFLPAQHTDFIFSVVGEELGFIGVAVALTLFLVLFMRALRIATRANDPFSSIVAFGLAASWFVHVGENVGMTLNLMPITGIPLPFFSYGGSFLLASWVAVGILVRISGEGRGRADTLAI